MDIGRLAVLMVVFMSSSGCSMFYSGARTLLCEPLHYCAPKDNTFATIRNRIVAEDVWRQFEKEQPDQTFSRDYASGFKDGYADYLYAGGSGEPPPLPPRRYWRKHYQTPAGHGAIEDWFSGFRHGASMAQASGQRDLVTVPTAIFTPGWPAALPPSAMSLPEHLPAAPPEVLPVPVEVPHAAPVLEPAPAPQALRGDSPRTASPRVPPRYEEFWPTQAQASGQGPQAPAGPGPVEPRLLLSSPPVGNQISFQAPLPVAPPEPARHGGSGTAHSTAQPRPPVFMGGPGAPLSARQTIPAR